MQDKVEEILAKVRPALERDGGNVELVGVEDGTVKVKLVGACAGGPRSTITLKNILAFVHKNIIIWFGVPYSFNMDNGH